MVSLIVIDMLFGCDHNKCKFGNYGLFLEQKVRSEPWVRNQLHRFPDLDWLKNCRNSSEFNTRSDNRP